MAFTPFTTDMNIISDLPDEPNTAGYTAAQLKAKFDESGLAIKNYLNAVLVAQLSSSMGAGNIGIDEIASMSAQTIQAALEELYGMITAIPEFSLPLPVAQGGTGQTTAAAALTALGGASSASLSSHTGDTENPHAVTAAQVGASAEGKLKLGDDEYTLQIGTAEDAAEGYITIVLET